MQIILSIHFFFLERFVSINLMNRIAKLMLMGCSLPLLGGTGACYRYIFTNIAKIQRLFHWSYDAYISTMLHIRMDNFQ